MKTTNIEIAESALCSEGAVRKAVERRKLDPESVCSVVGFVLAMRLKALGLCGVDDLPSGVSVGCGGLAEPQIDYSENQEEEYR